MRRAAIMYPHESEVGKKALSVYFLRDELRKLGVESKIYFADSPNLAELKNFDVILVSCHYENDYPNLVRMLKNAGIEIKKKGKNHSPTIILGGPVTINPLPLSFVVDLFFVGDGEVFFDQINHYGFDDALKLSDSIWPQESVKVAVCDALADRHPTESGGEDFFLEVQRGCRNRCLFCLIGWTRGKCRYRTLDDVKLIMSRVQRKRYRKIMLVGSDLFSNPEIVEIYDYLHSKGFDISTPSFHVRDVLEHRDFIKRVRPRILTLAPETSERLRYLVGKQFSDEDVVNAVKIAKKNGTNVVKFYFIVGLPYETTDDIMECVKLVRICSSISGVKIKCTFSIFVPKPHTPFQFAPFDSMESLAYKNRLIAKNLSTLLHLTNPKRAALQALLSIGDREVGDLLIHTYQHGLNYSVWKRKAFQLKIDLDRYLCEKDDQHIFGFENINTGVSKKSLHVAYRRYVDKALSR